VKRYKMTRHGRTFTVYELEPVQRPLKKAPRAKFVQVPESWIAKLVGQSGNVHDLALRILLEDFKHYGHPVKLSGKHLKMYRGTRARCLQRLAELGLISVELKQGSAPLVTVIR
jgi:hypothetical protein